ncbi:hypothetical protein NicSoilC12_26200 [Arthrobacter sp. NicSoilC12]|nr:hypothetical protein NicSoilC12_26200 [Arthrobacter sp. NicSoilC12]
MAAWSWASSRVVSAISLSTAAFLAAASSRAAFSPGQCGVGFGLEVGDFSLDGGQPGLRVDVGGALLGELVHRGVLAAQGLVREVDCVRQAAALVRAEEQGQVGRHAAGLVGLRGDLPDQFPGVRDLLFVGFQLLRDFCLVLLRQVHAGREGLHFLDRSGHPALGVRERLLGAGELALVQDQVCRGLGDLAVHEFEGVLDPGRLLAQRGLLVLKVVGECRRTRGPHGPGQDQRQGGADHPAAAPHQAEPEGLPEGAAGHRCHKHSLFVAQS